MAKFAIACPKCGKYAEAKTGFFARKKIECSCGNIIDVRTDKLASTKCPHCGNQVVYYDDDQGYIIVAKEVQHDSVLDENGKVVIPLGKYYHMYLGEGYASWEDAETHKAYIMDLKSKTKIDVSSNYLLGYGGFSEGLLNTGYAFINTKGEVVIDMREMSDNDINSFDQFHDGLVMLYDSRRKTDGYMNTNGEIVIDSVWGSDVSRDFSEGLAAVAKSKKDPVWCYIDTSGRVVIPEEYSSSCSFSEGLAAARKKGSSLWGYIDKKGNTVIAFQFDSAGSFVNGYALVTKGSDQYYIDKNGNKAFPFNVK